MLAVELLADLTGCDVGMAFRTLEGLGFYLKHETAGGYMKWGNVEDRSQVWIRPDGEVIRLGPKIKAASGKMYHPRYDQYGKRTRLHSTGERIRLDVGR